MDNLHDDAFAKYVTQTGMASGDQVAAARQTQETVASGGGSISLGEALVQQGIITGAQRQNVEKKLEAQREGVQQLGPFRLIRKIGEGGMGAVYLAQDTAGPRKVALKILPKKHAVDPEFLKRFRREAEAAARLDHPNIIRAYSTGEDHGYHYYAMEFCDGESLKGMIVRNKFIAPDKAVALIIQVAMGLKYAHEHGLIHRDIKPDNVIVTPKGIAKILDLGLSKNLNQGEDTFKTVTGAALGTPHYISPEQAQGEKTIDGRTDIYSLGATLYHLITGDTPFHGTTLFEIITKHLTEQLPDPRDLREGIPESVVVVIRRMMAKNREHRYRDCTELIADLELVASSKPPSSPVLDAELTSIAKPQGLRPRPARPTRTPMIMAAVAAAGVVVLALGYAMSGNPGEKQASPVAVAPKPPPPKPPPPPPPPQSPPPVAPSPTPTPAVVVTPTPEAVPSPTATEMPEPTKAPDPVPSPEPTILPSPTPTPEPPKPGTKQAVPDSVRLKESLKTLKSRFADDYEKLAPADLIFLAKKLVQVPPNDPELFIALREARDLAAQAGDLATAMGAVDKLAETFEIDRLALKTEAVNRAVANIKTKDGAEAAVTLTSALVEESVAADRYDLVSLLLPKAEAAAKVSQNPDLLAATKARATELAALIAEFKSVAGQVKTLDEKPDDPAANLALGRFLAFAKNDWARGLPMLARGSDAKLKSVAERELSKPEDGPTQIDVLEKWLDVFEKESVPLRKQNLAIHVTTWYDLVKEKLLDPAKGKIAKRMEAVDRLITGGAIDLLRLIDPAKDSFLGTWRFTGGVLSSSGRDVQTPLNFERLQIPYTPPDEYDLEISLERKSGNGDLLIAPVYMEKQFATVLDGWFGRGRNGLYAGTDWQALTPEGPPVLPVNRPVKLSYSIRKKGFTVSLDGKVVLTSVGAPAADWARLGIPQTLVIPETKVLSIGTKQSQFQFTKILLTPVTGKGKRLR